jgi:hypothetical protein
MTRYEELNKKFNEQETFSQEEYEEWQVLNMNRIKEILFDPINVEVFKRLAEK